MYDGTLQKHDIAAYTKELANADIDASGSSTRRTCLQSIKVASIGEGGGCLRAACSRAPTERGHEAFHLGGLPIRRSGLRGPIGGGNNPMLD